LSEREITSRIRDGLDAARRGWRGERDEVESSGATNGHKYRGRRDVGRLRPAETADGGAIPKYVGGAMWR
jgi:hypothetical protein